MKNRLQSYFCVRYNWILAALLVLSSTCQLVAEEADGGKDNPCLEPDINDPDDPRPTPDHVWADWDQCEWVIPVELSPAASQGYPNGAADIHPDICLNAQSEYTTTKYDVSIGLDPENSTASVSVESGDVSVSPNSVSDGDTITVTGNSTDPYEIKVSLTHDGTTYEETYSGTVFEFKFDDSVSSTDSGPKDNTSNGSYDVSDFKASSVSGAEDVKEGAFMSQNYLLTVITEPSNSFDGSVEASAKLEHNWDAIGSLVKSYVDGSGGASLSVGYGPVSASLSAASSEDLIAGLAVGVKIYVEDEQLVWTKDVWSYDTKDKIVSFPDPFDTFANSETGSNSPSDIKRDYDVGSGNGYNLRVQVGISASTNDEKKSGELKGAGVIENSYITGEDPTSSFEEDDGVFDIQ
ncbi:hypothetical protein DDZ13_00215 [Coraliomargarita sinensis]|uniref:Cadherin-like beta sandwich domain-containing protein n=1 Tax=Coraliomargarita sinensis TaxID=2174842 RepID=A0A317ZHY7_9BACT|nr:hypothetical protein [Coraliomargarita sinensis]PXA05324.1 hypothetical protein DDZ13_00215 [Coraliomargarita sinensis]